MKRKRILTTFIVLAIFTLCACNKNSSANYEETRATKSPTNATTQVTTQAPTDAPTQAPTANQMPFEHINFYNNRVAGDRQLVVGEVNATFVAGKNVVVYDVFPTNAKTVPNGFFKDVWEQYWKSDKELKGYKIGYEISFKTSDGKTFSKNILSPKDTEDFFGYVEVYLYDDTDKPRGVRYSHLLENEMTDTTLISSIKLHGGVDVAKIVDEITLMTYIYKDENDFDKLTGKYIGSCKSKIHVRKVQ